MGDREILETYLNSASKNTLETDIFPHGTKSLLTSVISPLWFALVTRSSSVATRQMCFYRTLISGNYPSLVSNECLCSVMHIEHCILTIGLVQSIGHNLIKRRSPVISIGRTLIAVSIY